MGWTDDYIGIPFTPDGRDRNGLDCYGLVCLVYKEQFKISLPDYAGVFVDMSFAALKKVARKMSEVKEDGWHVIPANIRQAFDVILLRTGTYQWHVALVINETLMLHVMNGIDVVVEPYTSILWKNRIVEFRRYDGR